MPQTHDIGRLFVHGLRYPMKGAPRWDQAKTVEVEPPYRVGKGITLRWGPRRALVIGRWGLETREEGEALYDALKARDMAPARLLQPGEDILAWAGAEEDLWEEEFGGMPVCAEPQPERDLHPDPSHRAGVVGPGRGSVG